MSGSWGHTVQPLEGRDGYSYGDELYTCGVCRCAAKQGANWLGTYRHVTGRAGRLSWARKYLCDQHAERFRQRWHPH